MRKTQPYRYYQTGARFQPPVRRVSSVGSLSTRSLPRLDAADKTERTSFRRWSLRFGIVVMLMVLLGAHVSWSKHAAAEAASQQAAVAAVRAQKAAVFSQQLNSLIGQHPELTISVALSSGDGRQLQAGTSAAFDGASTGKLLTAADYLHHVERGTASLTQSLDGHSAEYWLRIMIVNSDDSAWAELNDYLTHPDLERYATTMGYVDYNPDDNTFKSQDVATLLRKLYDHELLNDTDTNRLLGYMQQANYRDYIVPAVPADDTVYHKIGIDDDNVHDAAIITHGAGSLVLVIFTNGNGTYNWPIRAQLMQAITKDAIAAYL